MSKELIVSSSSQETKAAILEDGEVVEIHIEREGEQGIVGSICKGRVTKVLPGMQSAFVNIGLERDAFLYVSDFFEDTDEYDRIVSTAEDQVAEVEKKTTEATKEPTSSEEDSAASRYKNRRLRPRRVRRGRSRGKSQEITSSESGPTESASPTPSPAPVSTKTASPSMLPGESLAKYTAVSVRLPASKSESAGDTESAIAAETEPSPLKGNKRSRRRPRQTTTEKEAGDSSGAVPEEDTATDTEAVAQAEAATTKANKATDETSPSTGDFEPDPKAPSKEHMNLGSASEEPKAAAEKDSPTPKQEESSAVEVSKEAAVSAKLDLQATSELDIADTDKPQESANAENTETPPSQVTELATSTGEGPSDLIQPNDPSLTEQTVAESEPDTVEEPEVPSGSTSKSGASNAQHRSRPNTPRFFRRSPDRRRSQYRREDRQNRETASPPPMIADLLRQGQEILVQIAKEPLGTKGARITSHIALPGRFLVYMPTVNHIGVSRKISSSEERQRVKKIIVDNRGDLPGGFIVRTAAEHKGEDEFKADIEFLRALWTDVKSQSEKKSAPAIIHRELNLVQRILRDQFNRDFSAIQVDNELAYAGIVELIHRFQPSLVKRVKLYTRETPIFEEFGIQAELDKALRSKVWLKSGGYIVIDQAEALVAIDVNTGKYVGKSNKLEDTIAKTNVEAAKEIARQLRLRDLGGIIVCDFIDMEDRKNRLKVNQTLEAALKRDKSPSKVLQFNDFGLVAITRKRVKQSLLKLLCEPCSQCSGSGMVKSPQTVCYEIQGEARKMAHAIEDPQITVRVHPAVAKALKTTEPSIIDELELSLKKEVVIKSDPLFPQERFDIF